MKLKFFISLMMEEIRKVKYYEVGKALPFDETRYLELKGHRSICVEEIPPQCKNKVDEKQLLMARYNPKDLNGKETENGEWWMAERWFRRHFKPRQSRQPITKTVNAFLNSGHGGIILLGITDDGVIRGIKLTQYQIDHVKVSLKDSLQRFNPPVSKAHYQIRFIIVLEEPLNEDIENILNFKYPVDPNVRVMPHLLRTFKYCWCDNDAKALIAMGIIPPSYIIEIEVFPWKKPSLNDENNGIDDIALNDYKHFCPIYETEDGKCCFKRTASVVSHTKQQLYDITIQEVRRYCQNEIIRLDRRIAELNILISCAELNASKAQD